MAPQVLPVVAVRLLQGMLLIAALALMADLLHAPGAHAYRARHLFDALALVLIGFAVFELAHLRTNRALALLSCGVWLLVCLTMLWVTGAQIFMWCALPLCVFVAGAVLGRRATLTLLIATLVVLAATLAQRNASPISVLDEALFCGFVIAPGLVLSFAVATHLQGLHVREAQLNTELRDELAQCVSECERAGDALELAKAELERVRADLLHAEKLAALGSLIAGVSHELNAPLGHARLAASTLLDHIAEVEQNYRRSGLSRARVERFLAEDQAAAELVLRGLDRAAALVSDFKQLALDETIGLRREFDLETVVHQSVAKLRAGLADDPWEISIDVAPGVTLDGFPGVIEQIVTHLTVNSIHHGFAGRARGRINILARLIRASVFGDDQVVLMVEDDGVGIAPSALPQLFDPLFAAGMDTARPGRGLSLVHRLTTVLLGGRISVSSRRGGLTTFSLRLPRCAPPLS